MWLLLGLLIVFCAAIFFRIVRLEISADELVGKSTGFSADINRIKLEMDAQHGEKVSMAEKPVNSAVMARTDSEKPASHAPSVLRNRS